MSETTIFLAVMLGAVSLTLLVVGLMHWAGLLKEGALTGIHRLRSSRVETTGGLTPREKEVMDHLVDAWNIFIKLNYHSETDVREFQTALHVLQGKLAIRIARREHSDLWRSYGDKKGN